ncbi:MAG: sensor histidine kinase, partial [Streptosporangiaceae bacterium]
MVAAPSRAPLGSAFSPEPVRGMAVLTMPAAVTAPAPATAPAAAPPLAPGLPPRHAEPPGVFDHPHRETPRPAAGDGERFNTTFVSLSHRSQSLVERQIRLIEDLERGEQDPQRLTSLSRLNRIAVRIYRNSQNLLILAGHQPSPVWSQPVRLAPLVKAALAEVEDYERVSSDVQADVAVRGPAVNDLVHLLVELIENATSFSAAEMPVFIKGQILATGGALLDVTDRGIGMTAKEMAYANQQLDNPPAGNIDVPKWMGLLVVGRLAARHGIRVRLNQPEYGGLTALVWLPDEILTPAAADPGLAAAGQRTLPDG